MSKALLALGSNVGDRLGFLQAAVKSLGDRVIATSKVYETPPWPAGEDAPFYLNAAILVSDKSTDAYGWLKRAAEMEQAAGRERELARRYAPRTLDVDVVMVWDDNGEAVFSDDPRLTLPHPQAHLRAFVLKPWYDLQPDARLPEYGPVADLLQTRTVADELVQIREVTGGL